MAITNAPDRPTRTISAASEAVAKGFYNATTLSAVDADLAPANIKEDITIFGKTGTLTATLAEDTTGSGVTALTTITSDTYHRPYTMDPEQTLDIATKTLTYDVASMAVAVGICACAATTANTIKLRLLMEGVQVAESAYVATATVNIVLVATRAMDGEQECKLQMHNYDTESRVIKLAGVTSGGQASGAIGIGSIKTV